MSTSDDGSTDPALPDSAMASGSDAGGPGEHLGPSALDPDEQRLLDRLTSDVAGGPAGAPEETLAAVRAAEDEGPLPAHGGAQDDGLSVVFDPPQER